MAVLKENMITQEIFQKLEDRVEKLEGLMESRIQEPSSEIYALRQELSKLDPANKSIRIRGFKSSELGDRVTCIKDFFESEGANYHHIDHVYKGLPGQRSLTDMCIIECNSHSDREQILKDLNKKSRKDKTSADLNIDRAKTKLQLQRNSSLRKAADILKKDKELTGKKIEIIWKKSESGNKDREVKVNDQVTFCQKISDLKGSFVSPFNYSL